MEQALSYLAPRFIQHNPRSQDGVDGVRLLLQELKAQFPALRADVKRVFVDGDHVVLPVHAKFQPTDPGLAIVDMFRLEGGKIAEHWDVRQPVPEASANANGMF